MKLTKLICVAVVPAFLCAPAFAGAYAKFCAATKLEALQGATMLAETAVKTRKKGCVGPGKNGDAASMSYPDKDGEKCVGVHYNHQNGSCGIKKSPAELLKELTG